MEVHHHAHTADPDSHRGRKKWTHYLWEFLMLFLAVFCGFLAENLREHQVERNRGKQYIRSLIEDIKIDTANISNLITLHSSYVNHIDTLRESLTELRENGISATFMRSNRYINSFQSFIYTDRTIQQLKNSGGLRLIENKDAADSIVFYDSYVRDMLKGEEDLKQLFYAVSDQKKRIIDFSVWEHERKKFPAAQIAANKTNILITNNKERFAIFYNYMGDYAGGLMVYISMLNELKNKGGRLIAFLKKEYHLK